MKYKFSDNFVLFLPHLNHFRYIYIKSKNDKTEIECKKKMINLKKQLRNDLTVSIIFVNDVLYQMNDQNVRNT